jgi:rod shape-determining protein MreC
MEENKQLRKENANLRNNELKNFYRSESGKVIINDSLFSQQYSYVPSQILDNSYNRQQNYILINVGTSKGIKPDMGVIGPDGIVGFVKDVSSNYALVIPILNRHFSTSVMLKRNNHFGLLEWEGNDPNTANIKGVINTVDIQEGDTIVTKSANGRFPEGITVGTVKSIEEVQGDPHFDVTINLSSDFKTLHTVYVIINHHKKEFNAIRNLIDDEE